VETYRGRIKDKLGLSDSTELLHRAVQYAQDRGLV
jgi:DNA-binding CsgD family transcriptional regulator